MYSVVRPLLFALDPALAHALGMAALAPLEHIAPLRGAVRAVLARSRPRLVTQAMGLTFPSPLGMAAGFDKNARRARSLAALGFGHVELGTVTALGQEANPPPNLFRLPADRALINRLGFPNDGAVRVSQRLLQYGGPGAVGVPVGISIGKSRAVGIDLAPVVADYLASFRAVQAVADFVVVNVSSPNTKDLRSLQDIGLARELLSALLENARKEDGRRRVPLLVKIAPDQEDAPLVALLAVLRDLGVDGVVATNTTVSRAGLREPARVLAAGAGGLSGPPLRSRALDVVRIARRELEAGATVFGVGGIETADDVLGFVRAGANLVQTYTGFVYGGPWMPYRVAKDLDAKLAALGVSQIGDLVGREETA